jgi:glycosyltransferase involved in cell wall biosynthesis
MLAIVIPYFKLTFFEETLQSLASQTDQRFKVYIGDDASPENPNDLLEKYKGKFVFDYHRFEDNLGGTSLTQQWDRCIALSADEEWIMILGDDDMLGENVVEQFYDNYFIFEGISNVVRFATKVRIENENQETKIFFHPELESISDFLYRRINEETRSSMSEYIFSKEVYQRYGFIDYPLAWHSDDRAWIDFTENKPIFSINSACLIIGVSGLSVSGSLENVCLKNKAFELYFFDISKLNLKKISKRTKLLILMKYEVMIKQKRNLSWTEWLNLLKEYVSSGLILSSIKVFRRMLINRFR